MPELPEVESLRQSIREIVGWRIRDLKFSTLAPIEHSSASEITKSLQSAQVAELKRHGKYLTLWTEADIGLVIHLGMSGQLRLHLPRKEKLATETHTHLIVHFENGGQLHYRDPRRFGTLSLTRHAQGEDNPFLKRLGPDYISPKLKAESFLERCRRHPKIDLKSLTLNQSVAAGLGNIHACEALYRAGLDPRRRVHETQDAELRALLRASQITLELGIRYGGVSIRDYLNGQGHRGSMQDFLLVYDREGQMSSDGKGLVKRIVQQGRSTFFCPQVQK